MTAPGYHALNFMLDRDLEWQEQALCAQADPEEWFPEKGGSTLSAKRVCMRCPVRAECLKYAVDTDQRFGVWGGLSERERRKLQPSRKSAGIPPEASSPTEPTREVA